MCGQGSDGVRVSRAKDGEVEELDTAQIRLERHAADSEMRDVESLLVKDGGFVLYDCMK